VGKPEQKIEAIKETENNIANTFDGWYKTFEGAVENRVDWGLLKEYLPKNRNAKILDAAGGTGRIALPLARMGYSVTLCDISPNMLYVAKKKTLREKVVLNRVEILQCDIRSLGFADDSFDFVLCWDGAIEAAKELTRVVKKGGVVSLFLVNRCRGAIDLFSENPRSALAIVKSRCDYVRHHGEKYRAVNEGEARKLFAAEGIRVIGVYAVCGWMDVLGIAEKVRKSRGWKESFLKQTTQMVLKLSKEESAKGMSRHLVLYGEKK